MLIVVKIFLVALAVFGQAKLFPERVASQSDLRPDADHGLDSLVLPKEKPELALAQRAMKAEGLCRSAETAGIGKPSDAKVFPFAEDTAAAPRLAEPSQQDLATNCF